MEQQVQNEVRFFEKRMADLLVTPENNKIMATNPVAEFPAHKVLEMPLFEEDKDGNIIINFFHIDGERVTYKKEGDGKMSQINGKEVPFQQTRLASPIGDHKYNLPKGGGTYPFVAPLLNKYFMEGKKVDTVFLTEGAFKGWLSCQYDIPTFGLTSITHYKDGKTSKLHGSILRFLEKCHCKNLVILWDGDCQGISESDLISLNNLNKRPSGFYNAAVAIKGLILEINKYLPDDSKINIHHWSIRTNELDGEPKGIDDLLIQGKKNGTLDSIIRSMKTLQKRSNDFFNKIEITHNSSELKEFYRLDKAENFYIFHRDKIKSSNFFFFNDLFSWSDDDGGHVKLIQPGWAKDILWVGNQFFVKSEVPTSKGDQEMKLLQMDQSTLVKRLKREKFWTYLHHYLGFINIPSHWKYEQVIGQFYNRYFPFEHVPKPGTIDNTLIFVKHIFGEHTVNYKGKNIPMWEFGLDYVQLLLNEPTQPLPIQIFYSPENNTGKSTYGKWLRAIFGNNLVKISNKDLKGNFNAQYADKLIIWCEETLLEKKEQSEALKDMSTSEKVMLNTKNVSQYEVEFFGKFIFMTNNERMIYLNKHDLRYWIRRVPVLKNDDPDFLQKLEHEIPALIHILKDRKLVSDKESRMWFSPKVYLSKEFQNTVKVNEPTVVKELRVKLEDYFIDFSEDKLLIPMKDLMKYFMDGKQDASWVKEVVEKYLNIEPLKDKDGKSIQMRGYFWVWETSYDKTDNTPYPVKKRVGYNGRPLVFHRADFVAKEDEAIWVDGDIQGDMPGWVTEDKAAVGEGNL